MERKTPHKNFGAKDNTLAPTDLRSEALSLALTIALDTKLNSSFIYY